MASPGRHIIRTASLEVNAETGDAFRFQAEAVSWAQGELMRELEGIFAALPDDGSEMILDRLEIQVDASDPARWKTEILPQLRTGLATALSRAMGGAESRDGAEKRTAAAGFFRKLSHYLEHGVLPWNLMAEGRADLAGRMEEWLASAESRDSAAGLAVLWKLPSVRARFLQAFPPDLITRLLVRLYGMPEPLVKAWSRDSARVAAPSGLIPTALASGTTPDLGPGTSGSPAGALFLPVPLLQEILIALSHDHRVIEHGLEEEIVHAYLGRILAGIPGEGKAWRARPFESAAFRSSQERLLRRKPPESLRLDAPPVAPAGSASHTPSAEVRKSAPAPAHTPAAATRPRDADLDPASEGLFIPNAGLILLAPFLGMLFAKLGLSAAEGGGNPERLRDPGAAIALLHYLATAREAPAEFEVALAKVLCGVPLEETPSLPLSLPAHFPSECDQLLSSAIGHWTALGNTSPDGLREAFLQRPGKLTRRPQGDWLLQVEQKPYDMLLQQLPWSFRLVRLPWMDRILHTEWVD